MMQRRIRRALAAACLMAGMLILLRIWPHAPLNERAGYSTAFYADDGSLLRLTLARDEQYRLWTRFEAISPRLREAVLLYEDRWFLDHPGVNPLALLRSAWATVAGQRRQGGSTLTMQLARRLYDIDSRSVPGKLWQILAAFWLEARYSKHDILEAYLNFAPYGGNIEGVGAASLVFFHKSVTQISLPEILSLAVTPQNPRLRGTHGGSVTDARSAAHQRLAAVWLAAHPDDVRYGPTVAPPMLTSASLPFRAPHLTDMLLHAGAHGNMQTSISTRMQATVERSVTQYISRRRDSGLRNAVVLLLDSRSMQVKALAGSADFLDKEIFGQVNGTLAKRSPGSTLKPLIYALAIDQGILHPMSVLKDARTAFGPFSPENFDGEFVGPITAQEALVRSRNVPAVAVAAKLRRPNLYDLLKLAGVSRLESEQHYGLALTLGGGEVTMEELVQLYAMLARGGRWAPLRYINDEAIKGRTDTRLLSEEASFAVLEMLKTNPRPDTAAPSQPAVAWKTGTSWGFRDAWSIGIFDNYVMAVWIGNFDGEGNPAFVGVQAAAPLFFQIVDALRSQHLLLPANPAIPPPGITRIEVCAATGDLPNPECRQRTITWFIPGKSPIKVSGLHRRVLIDGRNGEVACEPSEFTHWEMREYWSSDMLQLFRQSGMPRRAPPPVPACVQAASAANEEVPKIVAPLRGQTYSIRLSSPQPIELRASSLRGKQFWFADSALLGSIASDGTLNWAPQRAGRYLLRVVDEHGNADTRELDVEFIP